MKSVTDRTGLEPSRRITATDSPAQTQALVYDISPSFSGVTKSGRVWRKVPESDARTVRPALRFSFSFSVFLESFSLSSRPRTA